MEKFESQVSFFAKHKVIVFNESEDIGTFLFDCERIVDRITQKKELEKEDISKFEIFELPEPTGKYTYKNVLSLIQNDSKSYQSSWDTNKVENNYKDGESRNCRFSFLLQIKHSAGLIDLTTYNDFLLLWQKYMSPESIQNDSDTELSGDGIEHMLIVINDISSNREQNYHRLSEYFVVSNMYYLKFFDSIHFVGYRRKKETDKPRYLRLEKAIRINKHELPNIVPVIPINLRTNIALNKQLSYYFETYELLLDFKDSLASILKGLADNNEVLCLKVLLCRIVDSLFNKDSQKEYKHFVYDKIKDLTLLQFIIATRYINLQNNGEILKGIQGSKTIGAGTRQLLENIVFHSSEKQGIFELRIYSSNTQSHKEYLKHRYSGLTDVLEEDDDIEKFYYEILIRDISKVGIVDTFVNNLPDRLEGLNVDEETSNEIFNKASTQINAIEDFFKRQVEEGSFWKDYYINCNAAFNQGLTIFKQDIANLEGKGQFIIQSCSSGDSSDSNNRRTYYCSENVKPFYTSLFSGTSITALYPAHERRGNSYCQLIDIKTNPKIDFDRYKIVDSIIPEEYHAKSPDTQIMKESIGREIYDNIIYEAGKYIFTENHDDSKEKPIPIIKIDLSNIVDATIRESTLKNIGSLLPLLSDDNVLNKQEECVPSYAICVKSYEDIVSCIDTLKLPYFLAADQQGSSSASEFPQIFIYDINGQFQLLWMGRDLEQVLAVDQNRTFYYGSSSLLSELVTGTNNKRILESDSIEYHPFPLLLKTDTGTLFEKNIEYLLNGDITDDNKQGYVVTDTHMRLGSKIHIEDFFLAESLFQNSYFISGYANIIAKKINEETSKIKKSDEGLILLVGYGLYSELFMYTLKQLVTKPKKKDVEYLIFDPVQNQHLNESQYSSPENRFYRDMTRIFNSNEKKQNIYVFQIVGINTTFTTFTKVYEHVYANWKQKISNEEKSLYLLGNYAPIIVRDSGVKENGDSETEMEKLFFRQGERPKELTTNTYKIENALKLPGGSKMLSYDDDYYHIEYFSLVETRWMNPENCEKCLPENMVEEEPLIDTNRASVIPAIQFGENKLEEFSSIRKYVDKRRSDSYLESEKLIAKYFFDSNYDNTKNGIYNAKVSASSVIYRHIVRNDNHFQYYVKTDDVFRKANKKKEMKDWLSEIRNTSIEGNGAQVCNVIIAPMHNSNTGLLSSIKDVVFENKVIVLHSEVEREFKDNFQTKYQFIAKQIDAAIEMAKANNNSNYVFNFYYVDDTINSGNTINRAKTLINSLVGSTQYHNYKSECKDTSDSAGKVEIRVFKKVILLLNRMSNNSKKLYVDELSQFHSFIELGVSSIRTHKDACYLCNIVKDSIDISIRSATETISSLWYLRGLCKSHLYLEDEEHYLEGNNDKDSELSMMQKSYYRLFCAKRAHLMLNNCNNKEFAMRIIIILLNESINYSDNNEIAFEWIVSYIKTLSRPFMSFRKAVKEAIFRVLLELIEGLINPEYVVNDDIKSILKVIEKDNKNKILFIKTIIKRLSKMDSNYILRSENYNRLNAILGSEELNNNDFFIMNVKQVIEATGDETKSFLLEKNLISLDESKYYFSEEHDLQLYVENTRIIRDGIEELSRKKNRPARISLENNQWDDLNIYYLSYFKKILIKNDINIEGVGFPGSEGEFSFIIESVNFFDHLNRSSNISLDDSSEESTYYGEDIIQYYNKLCKIITKAIGAESVCMIGCSKNSDIISDSCYLVATNTTIDDSGNSDTEEYKVYEKFVDEIKELSLHEEKNWILDSFFIPNKSDKSIDTVFCKLGGNSNNDTENIQRVLGNNYSVNIESIEKRMLNDDIRPRISDDIFIRIEYKKSSDSKWVGGIPIKVAFGLRMVLMFRHNIIRHLEHDFNNNLLKIRRTYELWRNQIEKARAFDHKGENALVDEYNSLVEGKSDNYFALRIVSNQYIGRLNMRLISIRFSKNSYKKVSEDVIREKLSLRAEGGSEKKCFSSDGLDSLIDIIRDEKIPELKITHYDKFKCLTEEDKNKQHPKNYKYRANKSNYKPGYQFFAHIILSVILNGIEHRSSRNKETSEVEFEIFTEPSDKLDCHMLIIRNKYHDQNQELTCNQIQDEIVASIKRKSDGITLAVIFESLNWIYSLWGTFGEDDLVDIEEYESEKYFTIKLPILEKEN